MQKVNKLPSGKYIIQVYDQTIDGKRKYRSFTSFDKDEVRDMARAFEKAKHKARKERKKHPEDLRRKTVGMVLDQYLATFEAETDIIDPKTLDEYYSIRRNAFPHLMDVYVDTLDNLAVREAIKTECSRRSIKGTLYAPKTIHNRWGLISEALKNVCGLKFDVSLPKIPENDKTLPELDKVLEVIRSSGEIQLPCMLGLHSLRMSEILGLKCDAVDLGKQMITVRRKRSSSRKGTITSNRTKTKDSRRIVHISDELADLIYESEAYQKYVKTKKNGFIVNLTYGQIAGRYRRLMELNNLDITFHNLRTIYASAMLNILKVPVRIVEQEGGWKPGSTVLRKYYSKSFDSAQLEAAEMRDELYRKSGEKMQSENEKIQNAK